MVEFYQDQKTFDNYMDLKFYLEDLFGRKVDLVIAEAIKPDLKPPALRGVCGMPRDYKAYLSDIIGAVNKIERYTNNLSFQDFLQNELVQDGVVRNLEIIGEAVKKIPDHIKRKKPDIEWKKIAGLRDILIHDYFGIDVVIVWDIIKNKIPVLKKIY